MDGLKMNLGLFAQDQWKIDRLTLNLGLRFDYANGYVPAQHTSENRYVPARDFAPVNLEEGAIMSAHHNGFDDGQKRGYVINRRTVLESAGLVLGAPIAYALSQIVADAATPEQTAATSSQSGIRIVITANNPQGRSYVASDQRVTRGGIAGEVFGTTIDNPLGMGSGVAGPSPAFLPTGSGLPAKPSNSPVDLPVGATRLAYGSSPPAVRPADPRADMAGWHRTSTVDYIVVVRGELTALLEEGPEVTLRAGDILIQRNTNHAWRNYSQSTVSWVAVVVPIRRDA